jgi:hypothetical protein
MTAEVYDEILRCTAPLNICGLLSHFIPPMAPLEAVRRGLLPADSP